MVSVGICNQWFIITLVVSNIVLLTILNFRGIYSEVMHLTHNNNNINKCIRYIIYYAICVAI